MGISKLDFEMFLVKLILNPSNKLIKARTIFLFINISFKNK